MRSRIRAAFGTLSTVAVFLSWARAASPPPPRDAQDVEAALAEAPHPPSASGLRELHIVLLANEKDHGPQEHDYPLWQKRWAALLGGAASGESQANLYGPPPADPKGVIRSGAAKVRISTAWEWPDEKQLRSADVIIAFTGTGGRWNAARIRDLEVFLARGGGFVALHSAVITEEAFADSLARTIGLAWKSGTTTFRHGPVDLVIADREDSICRGLPAHMHFEDETYWPLVGDRTAIRILATAEEETPGGLGARKAEPMVWTYTRGKGRVFGFILGHYTWSFDDPFFRALVLRGTAWAAGESPYRFDPLILRAARIREGGAPEGLIVPGVRAKAPDPADERLFLWLDASDRASLTLDADGRVSAWANQAAKVGRALRSEGKARPAFVEKALADRPALRFDGLDDVLRDTGFGRRLETWTLFAIATIRSNTGGFRCLFSGNRKDVNDYVSGINIDFGGGATAGFDVLNLEGPSHAGQSDLRIHDGGFGSFIIAIASGDAWAQAFVNGAREGIRDVKEGTASLAEIRIGARMYANPPGKLPLVESGFIDGDIAEVILFGTELSEEEMRATYAYLDEKYGKAIERYEEPTLEGAFGRLPSYRIGERRAALGPIDAAISASHGDAAARADLETRLIAILGGSGTADAKDFVCRRLGRIGTDASVPALEKLLFDGALSCPARCALERIATAQARRALREAIPRLRGDAMIGAINSLGSLRDREAATVLVPLLEDGDGGVASAAAAALGRIGEPELIEPLLRYRAKRPGPAADEACLEMAARLVEQGRTAGATRILERLAASPEEVVRRAAARVLKADLSSGAR
ncbi:MAG: ThuA domain-containing protein [Planctomycetes bacterium]|nr:ThuA domain-containing protein [Planctomycetota bacterium]